MKKWPLRSATKLSVSQRPRNSRHWIKRFAKQDKLQVIVNGIDIEEYEQRKIAGLSTVSRKSCGIPESAFVVGMVGRISEQKAPDVFIKAAKQIKQKIQKPVL